MVAVTGGSGASLGIKLYNFLPPEVEKFLIISEGGKRVLNREEGITTFPSHFESTQIDAPLASGSFPVDLVYIVPTSMNTLAKLAGGVEDNLITRVGGVAIKEKRRLILAPREMPFSPIHLQNMLKLAQFPNVIIAPPIIAYYSQPNSIGELERFIIGRWLDFGKIPNNLYRRWK